MAKRITNRRGYSPSVVDLEDRTLLAALGAHWYGSLSDNTTTPADMTGASVGVGPDGLTDNLLMLNGLDPNQQLSGVRLTDLTNHGVWGYGLDPLTVSGGTYPVTIGAGSLAVVRPGSQAPFPTTAALFVNAQRTPRFEV